MKSMSIPNFENYFIFENGTVFNTKTNNWLKPYKNASGYLKVTLNKGKISKRPLVHRLVLLAFKPILDKNLQVNHIDGNKQNNLLNNLEWCTPLENVTHAIKNGLSPQIYKLDRDTLTKVLNEYLSGIPFKELQVKYKCTSSLNTQLIRLAKELGKYPDYKNRRSSNAKIAGIKGRSVTYLIHQFNLNNVLITTFNSIKEASEKVNISRPSITEGCKTGKIVKGYIWKKELL
jgi:hypothetical protein